MSHISNLINLTLHGKEDIDEHIMTLFSLAISVKPKKIIELGVRSARSSYAFLSACILIDSKLTSVDIQNPSPSLPLDENLTKNWKFIKSDALKFLETSFKDEWGNSEGNILYIDDWHSGDHVEKEINLVKDYITPKDIIILHDLMYGHSEPNYRSVESPQDKQWDNGGPYKPVSELDLKEWEYSTIPRCHGLTILRKRGEVLTK